MAKEYRNNISGSEKYTSGRYGSVYVDIEAVVNATNTALTQSQLDMKQVSLDIILNRKFQGQNVTHVIYSGDLQAIVWASSFKGSSFDLIAPTVTADNGYTILVQEAVGINAVGLKAFEIPFGGAIDCDVGESELSVQLNCGSTVFSTAINNTSSSIIVGLIPTDAPEEFLPAIYQEYIDAGSTIYQVNLQGIVKEAILCNYDKASNLDAVRIVNTCNISDSKGNQSVDYNRLLGARQQLFQDIVNSETRCQSQLIIPFSKDKFKSGVTVSLTLQGSNVVSSMNNFVAWYGVLSKSSVSAYQNAQHQNVSQVRQLVATISEV